MKILFDVSFAINRLPRMVPVGKRRICAKYELVRVRGKRAPGAPTLNSTYVNARKTRSSSKLSIMSKNMSDYMKKVVDLDREHLLYSVTFFPFSFFSTHEKRNGKITSLILKIFLQETNSFFLINKS